MKTRKLFGPILAISLAFAGCGPEKTEEKKPANDAAASPAEAAEGRVADVSAEEAKQLIDETRGLVVLDVRTPEEFAEGHIKGAINIDVKADSFAEEVAKLNPETPFLVHCRSGRRSLDALDQMKPMPFERVYHLDSGIQGWEAAGFPVEK